ncbi:hypothetical protein P7C70_g7295, partial [Phenoliferia sp. Uapishka_3]
MDMEVDLPEEGGSDDEAEAATWAVIEDDQTMATGLSALDAEIVPSPALPSTPPRTRRPMPAGTSDERQRDYFDEQVLEHSRPAEFQDYSGNIPVDEFLSAPIPSGCFRKRGKPAELLSTKEPTSWPNSSHPGLHNLDIHQLEGLKYVAWRDNGVRSIQSPTKPDVRWPLWVLDFWRDQARMKEGKEMWRDAISYLEEEVKKAQRKVVWHTGRLEVTEANDFQSRLATFASTLARVHTVGWTAVVSTRTAYDTLQLAKLLGNKWTTVSHLDTALSLLQRRTDLSALPYEARFEDSFFSLGVLKHLKGVQSAFPPKSKVLVAAASWLKEGRDTGVDRRLYAIAHIRGNHWIAIHVRSDGTVGYADSLEEGAQLGGTAWWKANGGAYRLFAKLAGLQDDGGDYPLHRLKIGYQNGGAQGNSWDCGPCAVNALSHAVFDDELWTPSKSAVFRVRMFLEGLDMDAKPEQRPDVDIVMGDIGAPSVDSPVSPPPSPLPSPPTPPNEPVEAGPSAARPTHSFFSQWLKPRPPPTQPAPLASKKRKTRGESDEEAEGRIDPVEEPVEDAHTRRSKWTSGSRVRVAAHAKASVFEDLLRSEVLKSFDDTGFYCNCTPKKYVHAPDFNRQRLKQHCDTQKHSKWLASRASSRMLLAQVTAVPSAFHHPRPRAVIVEPTSLPCNNIQLSQIPSSATYAVPGELLPSAACLGLHDKKFAPLFSSLSDFGGLGANDHIIYGKKAFAWKAWDGRPESKWETSSKAYPRLPMVESYGCRKVLIGKWTTEERRKYTREAKRRAIWYLERVAETVRAGACTLSMTGPRAHVEGVCSACSALLKNPTFKQARRDRTKASNRLAKLPEEKRQDKAYKKQTHTPSFRVSEHKALLRKYQHLPAVAELSQTLELETDSRLAPFIKLQAFAARGLLKGKEVMTGLIECLVQKVEIEQSDDPEKQKHRIRYAQDVMDWAILVRARGGNSAVTYEIVNSQLPLPHARTVKKVTAKSGMGFALDGTDLGRLKRYWAEITAKSLSHHPVANPALTHTRNFSNLCANGHILGSILSMKEVEVVDENSPAAITAAVKEQQAIATQVRAVLVKLPLDGEPGLVIHLSATNGTSTGEQIYELTCDIRRELCALGAKVVASAADGAGTELRAQDLAILNHAGGNFVLYDNDKYDLHLRAPIHEDSGPEVGVQDAGHAKKTGRNNATGGATFLSLGNCSAGFSNLLTCLLTGISGLIDTDVLKIDKQDDAAARRTMLAQLLRSCLDADGNVVPEQKGLFGYLTILGEIFDAWFNRTMRIEERLKICFRGLHFLRNWRRDIVRLSQLYPGIYSLSRGFLSPAANRILLRQCESLILLVISYRDFYPNTPFCPWQISSAPLEHWFGLCRQLEREFTIGSLFEMVKNVDLRHKILSSGRFAGKKERSGRRGYDHQTDSAPLTADDLEAHRTFPSKSTMDRLADEAWEEMASLSEWLGIPVPYLPLQPSAQAFVVFAPGGCEESDRADDVEYGDLLAAGDLNDDEDDLEEALAEAEDEDEPEIQYDYPIDPNASTLSSVSAVRDFGPAVDSATSEMVQRQAFRDRMEQEEVDLALDEAELEPEAPLPEALTSERKLASTILRAGHVPKPDIPNSFAASRSSRQLDVSKVIALRNEHSAGTHVQKERQKGPESLLVNPVVLTAAGLIRPNVISNALRVAQETTTFNKGSRVQSRWVRWAGTSTSLKAAASTQFGEALGPFRGHLLDTRGVSVETPLLTGSWMICRNPGAKTHAPFWFIGQNMSSYTKTDKAGNYSHAESIIKAETIACMHVRVYKQIPTYGEDVDVEDDVFRHEIRRRPLPTGTPLAGTLPPGRDALLAFVPGSEFVYKFPGDCFLPGGGEARALKADAAVLWKTFNSLVVANAFAHALGVEEEDRTSKKKQKAALAKEARAQATRELDRDGKGGERLMEKKRAAAVKKAEKEAAPRNEKEEAKKLERKLKAAAVKAAKDGGVPKPAKKGAKVKDTWDWTGWGKPGGSGDAV